MMAIPEERPSADDVVTLDRAATVARLLGGVVHDVNNALLVISGTAEMLEDQSAGLDATLRGLGRIRTRTAKAAAAITEVLAFARGSPADRGSVNLRDIVARAVELRTFSVKRAGLAISFTPPAAGSVTMRGSQVLLLQAVLDLLTNAEQALAGQSNGEIRVDLAAEAGQATVRVADNGPGVSPEHRPRLFEPFFTTRARSESSGLGLAAARRIAELHGGTVVLEESVGGATFTLRLPLE